MAVRCVTHVWPLASLASLPLHEGMGLIAMRPCSMLTYIMSTCARLHAGRPVLAVNSGGPTESVVHGTTGLLAEPTPGGCLTRYVALLHTHCVCVFIAHSLPCNSLVLCTGLF